MDPNTTRRRRREGIAGENPATAVSRVADLDFYANDKDDFCLGVVLIAPEGGYWGEVPALPGCFSQGETLEETKRNLQEAVMGYGLALTTPPEVRP